MQNNIYILDYRHAILEIIIALEIVLFEFITARATNRGIKKSDVEKTIKDIGLTGNIKFTLQIFLIEEEINSIESDILEKCGGGITLRNKITHQGLKEIGSQEAKETLRVVNSLITSIKSFTV